MQSKTAILILIIILWNLCVTIGLEFFLLPLVPVAGNTDNVMRICVYGVLAILLFYPLAGYLANEHWGRYETILGSLHFILLSLLIIVFLGVLSRHITSEF